MIEIGEQLRPTDTSGPRTRPKRPRMRLATGSLASVTVLQHWTGPVEHEPGLPEGLLLFAARRTRTHQHVDL